MKPTGDRAAELFKKAGRAEPLSAQQLEAVWKRTAPKLSAGPGFPGAKWLGAGAIILAMAAAWVKLSPEPVPAPPVAALVPKPLEPKPIIPSALEGPPPIIPSAVERPPPKTPKRAPLPASQGEGDLSEDPLLAESRLLATAVRQLREEHAPTAALQTLDEYDQKFPSGVLHNEATLARVEALVSASRRPQALALLQSVDLSSTPRGDELRVLQGELLLEAGNRAAARGSFEQALNAPLVRDAEERALFGLASTLDDEQAARQAFERYLSRFPRGRFAVQARAQLALE